MQESEAQVREAVMRAALTMSGRLTELLDEIRGIVNGMMPMLKSDAGLAELHAASVQQVIGAIVEALRLGLPVDEMSAPLATLEYTRRLAQQDEGNATIGYAYATAHQHFLHRAFEALETLPLSKEIHAAATLAILEKTSTFWRRLTAQAIASYYSARDERMQDRSSIAARTVRSLLRGDAAAPADLRLLSGYDLGDDHLAVVLWADDVPSDAGTMTRLREALRAMTNAVGCKGAPLYVSRDAANAWAWLRVKDVDIDWTALRTALDENAGDFEPGHSKVFAAIGGVGRGVNGFRRSHRQACAARAVAMAPDTPRAQVTLFRDVATIASMCADLDSARAWVAGTLGPLAVDDTRHAQLRDTSRVFLATGGSYVATARILHVHRNTAQYRVMKAEESLGRPLRDKRLDVEIALRACHWLGRAVLRPAVTPTAA